MTPERFREIEELFFQVEKLPAGERDAFLGSAAARDREAADEVARLLGQADAELALTAIRDTLTTDKASAEIAAEPRAERIGNYYLVRELGRGGMGVVYEAQQREPVRRRVALKVVKLGMDSREVVARFENERQTLAMMNHPNVACVHDGGTTEKGRPYFVMEYVDGPPLTDYCDQQGTAIRPRIELFIQVCEAVQHAHQKGIIHRDLKPSNILVEEAGGKALPKVIDFGVAKAIDRSLTDQTLMTRHGQSVGTPEYMSPEQAEGAGRDVDTRTDVYALGIILYELLTGTLPFESARLRPLSWTEVQRVICDAEPDRPSTRLRRLAGGATRLTGFGTDGARAGNREKRPDVETIARRRGTEPRALARRLRGDLDWVVLKCLEKDRSRRYESAAALAEDLRRYLRHEPAAAGPPGAAYRVKKYVRRNRGLVIAASLILALLLTATGGMSVLAVWALDERDQAARAQAEAERRAAETEKVAEFQAATLENIDVEGMGLTILSELRGQVEEGLRRAWVDGGDGRMRKRTEEEIAAHLAGLDAALSPGNWTEVARRMMEVGVLRPAVEALAREFVDQPLLDARLRYSIGIICDKIGLVDEAATQLGVALEIHRKELGNAHQDTWRSMLNYACVLRERGERTEAEGLLREALSIARGLHGENHLDVARTMSELAKLLMLRGDNREAETWYRTALEIYRVIQAENQPSAAYCQHGLSLLLANQGDFEAARELARRALETRRRFSDDRPMQLASSLRNLSQQSQRAGNYDEAEDLLRQSAAICRKNWGENHPFMATYFQRMGALQLAKGEYAEAEASYREALRINRKVFGKDNPKVAVVVIDMAELLVKIEKHEEAETSLQAALGILRAAYGDRSRNVVHAYYWLGQARLARGDFHSAEDSFMNTLRTTSANDQSWAARYRSRVATRLVELYEAWDAAAPGQGYLRRAAEWKVEAEQAPSANQAGPTTTGEAISGDIP